MERDGDLWFAGGGCPSGPLDEPSFRFVALGVSTLVLPLLAFLLDWRIRPDRDDGRFEGIASLRGKTGLAAGAGVGLAGRGVWP